MFINVSHPHSSLQSHIFVLKKKPAYYNYTNICNILIFYVYASLKIKFKKCTCIGILNQLLQCFYYTICEWCDA